MVLVQYVTLLYLILLLICYKNSFIGTKKEKEKLKERKRISFFYGDIDC